MQTYENLKVEQREHALFVTLDRPDVHNAFNDALIREAIDLFAQLPARVRAVVLCGSGPNFCAGADLKWMARMIDYGREENIRDSSMLAKMFALIDECPVPVIGRVQGAAIGGGAGLVAVCDIAIATADTRFGLSEVKLGIVPAVISPYMISKIGVSHARALFLTGERFDAERALQIGLVHKVVGEAGALDESVEQTLSQLASSGPEAVRACKRLISEVAVLEREDAIPRTIELIAERRTSAEGQEGMRAFLDKRKPAWSAR